MIVFKIDVLLADTKNLSKSLAEALNVTPQTISRINCSKSKQLSIELLDGICKFFNCQPGQVMEYIPDEDIAKRFGDSFVKAHPVKRSHDVVSGGAYRHSRSGQPEEPLRLG